MRSQNEEEDIIKIIKLLDIPEFIKKIIINNAYNLNLEDVIRVSNNFIDKRDNIIKKQQNDLIKLKVMIHEYDELTTEIKI